MYFAFNIGYTNQDLKRALGASAIPETIIVKNNEILYQHTGYRNAFEVAGSADIEAGVFYYMPHGIGAAQGGTSTNNNDIYFIHYAPHTTAAGEILGRDYDGFVLKAYRNVGNDQAWGGTNTVELITELDWKTPEP